MKGQTQIEYPICEWLPNIGLLYFVGCKIHKILANSFTKIMYYDLAI